MKHHQIGEFTIANLYSEFRNNVLTILYSDDQRNQPLKIMRTLTQQTLLQI